MAASVTTVEAVVNIALEKIGYPRRVGDIFEGSRPSKVALDLYGQTRDEMLRKLQPGFATREVTLSLLKTAPAGGYGSTPWSNTYPQLPYAYEYGYPADCIRILQPQLTPAVTPEFDPQPILYKVANDNSYTPPRRVILSQTGPTVVLTYVGQVTDMSTWDVSFVEAMTDALAKKFTIALASGQQMIEILKAESAMEGSSIGTAESREET